MLAVELVASASKQVPVDVRVSSTLVRNILQLMEEQKFQTAPAARHETEIPVGKRC